MRRWIILGLLLALATLTYLLFPKLLPEASTASAFGGKEVLFLQDNLRSLPMDWFTVIVYTAGYLVVIYGTGGFLLWKRDYNGFTNFLLVFVLAQSLGLITWALHPVAPPRHLEYGVEGVIGIRALTMGFTLRFDPYIYGAFPSLHTANGLTAALFVRRHGKKITTAWLCLLALSIFSMIYLGEHYWEDVLAGCFYSIGPYLLVTRMIGKRLFKANEVKMT